MSEKLEHHESKNVWEMLTEFAEAIQVAFGSHNFKVDGVILDEPRPSQNQPDQVK